MRLLTLVRHTLVQLMRGYRWVIITILMCVLSFNLSWAVQQQPQAPPQVPRVPPPISQQPLDRLPSMDLPEPGPPALTPKQQRDMLKSNFQKLKDEADKLEKLAKSLQDEVNKSNQNVLSLRVVDKAGEIEKLAKKIRSEAVQ